jgi:uncharacterized protein YfkK (UPF0435 family)
MKVKIVLIIIVIIILLTTSYLILKINIPLFYSSVTISYPAVKYVFSLQNISSLSPSECAERYLYFNTDYHTITPDRMIIKTIEINDNIINVKILDPNCRDDSVYSSLDIITLVKTDNNLWKPVNHKTAHKGRGRIGWTIKPTS